MNAGPIVVGLDGSDPSWAALQHALRLSRALGATLVAAFVPHDPAIAEFSASALAADREIAASIEATIRQKLTDTAPDIELTVLGHGPPGAELATHAFELHAEMIVVATRGHGLVRGSLLGSVAHHLVTHAKSPVLVVR